LNDAARGKRGAAPQPNFVLYSRRKELGKKENERLAVDLYTHHGTSRERESARYLTWFQEERKKTGGTNSGDALGEIAEVASSVHLKLK